MDADELLRAILRNYAALARAFYRQQQRPAEPAKDKAA